MACAEVRAKVGECPRGITGAGVRRAACNGRPVWLLLKHCKAQRSRLQSAAVIERKQASPLSLKAGVVCKEPRWQSAAVNRGGEGAAVKGSSRQRQAGAQPLVRADTLQPAALASRRRSTRTLGAVPKCKRTSVEVGQ
jgi:hypothetical protein